MNPDTYVQQAMRSALLDRPLEQQLLNAALGLAGEAGEVADIVKKGVFHNHPIDYDKLDEELGDLCWYVALYCTATGRSFEQILLGNIQKLLKRYPDKFSPERSINREAL